MHPPVIVEICLDLPLYHVICFWYLRPERKRHVTIYLQLKLVLLFRVESVLCSYLFEHFVTWVCQLDCLLHLYLGFTNDQNWKLYTASLSNFEYTLDFGEAAEKVSDCYIRRLARAHKLRRPVLLKLWNLTHVVLRDGLKLFAPRYFIVI